MMTRAQQMALARRISAAVVAGRGLEAAKMIDEAVRNFALCPRPELVGTHATIMYFATEADLDEFVTALHEIKPTMRSEKL